MLITHAETRSVTIAVDPRQVLALIGDGDRLPDWAPAFAPSVRRDGEHWRIGPGEHAPKVSLRVAPAAGTVDIVAADDARRGAFMRALPNADGTELLFTLFFPPGTPDDAIAGQMAEVEAELQRVRALCEG